MRKHGFGYDAFMDDATGALDHVRLDSEGRIDTDLECMTCGYNLRTRLPDSTCPECGDTVLQSMRYLLRFADPAWLRRLAWGAACIAAAIGWQIAVSAVWLVVIASGLSVSDWFSWLAFPDRLLFLVLVTWCLIVLVRQVGRKLFRDLLFTGAVFGVILSFRWLGSFLLKTKATPLAGGLSLAGWWLLTTREPGRSELVGKFSIRRVARATMSAAIMGGAVYWLLFARRSGWLPPAWAGRAPIVAVHVLGLIVAFRYLANLAKRIPKPRLAKHAMLVGWCLGILTALVYMNLAAQFMAVPPGGPTSAWGHVLIVGAWLTGIAGEAIRLWALVVCILYARVFWRIARVAAGVDHEQHD